MLPGQRDVLDYTDNRAFLQLLGDVTNIHKLGFLHCDIRPSNCLKINNRWHIIDFDLAVKKDHPKVTLWSASGQYRGCGHGIKSQCIGDGDNWSVQWSETDDIEMLYQAFISSVPNKESSTRFQTLSIVTDSF
jgi:serine/threonine protein kinase